MQPNKAASAWGGAFPVMTGLIVIGAVLVAVGLLSAVPGTGWSPTAQLAGHVCVTVEDQATEADTKTFTNDSEARHAGVAAPTGRVYCVPRRNLDHATTLRTLAVVGSTPLVLAAWGLLLAARRVMSQTRELGPFHPDTARRFARLRWWAAGAVALATVTQWVAHGVVVAALTKEPWPDLPSPWYTVLAALLLECVAKVCAFGGRQRHEAYLHGLADRTTAVGQP